MTLYSWIEIWQNTYKRPYLKKSGLECLRYCLKHILPVLGSRDIVTIKGYELQQLITSLSNIPNMQHKVKVYLNDIFEYAWRNDLVVKNPMLAIKFKPPVKAHRRAMTLLEQNLFIKKLEGERIRLLILTYLYTGCRRNEVILPGSFDVDFDLNTIFINGTKTKNSIRHIPLFPNLKVELEKTDYKKYFSSFTPDYVTHKVHDFGVSIGLDFICVHSLRTTFATRCIEAGISPKVLQLWLGHSKIDTTMDIYADGRVLGALDSVIMQKEVLKMGEIMQKGANNAPYWSG